MFSTEIPKTFKDLEPNVEIRRCRQCSQLVYAKEACSEAERFVCLKFHSTIEPIAAIKQITG